jgi:hypothetical protein
VEGVNLDVLGVAFAATYVITPTLADFCISRWNADTVTPAALLVLKELLPPPMEIRESNILNQ